MTICDPIFSRDSNGRTRSWQFEVEGDKWRTLSGLVDGAKAVSGWTTAKPKNVGKKNATTGESQAIAEAWADHAKKLDRDYRRTVAELDDVPPSPMLAETFAKKNVPAPYPVGSQPKLDGFRCLMGAHAGFSRSYQRFASVDHILAELSEFFAEFPTAWLDGELYNHELKADFNTLSSLIRKEKPTHAERAKAASTIQYHVYDVVLPGHIEDAGYLSRRDFLAEFLPLHGAIHMVPTDICSNLDELDAAYARYTEDGYEGQMVRVLATQYEIDKRSKGLQKRKQFDTAEFKVVDIQEGNGNWAGYAKRIIVRLADGRLNEAGMRGTQLFAAQLLADRERYIGGEVTIRYFGVTPDGKLRMPVAIDFHPEGRKD